MVFKPPPVFLINSPKDKNIVLADILENGVTDRSKSYCLDAHYASG